MSVVKNWNQRIIEEFRANKGRVGGRFAGNRLLLLHTIGARSGKRRVNPLVTLEDDGRLIVVASKAGAPTHPDWYYNLIANPDVEVEYGMERFPARAIVTEEPERSELFARIAAVFPGFNDYVEQTTRVLPVIKLEQRAAGSSSPGRV